MHKIVFFLALNQMLFLQCTHKQYVVHVFVHGSVAIGTAALDVGRAWNDTFTGKTWSERTLDAHRTDPYAFKSDLMLQKGLVDITQHVHQKKLDDAHKHQAAYHIVRAFDRVARAVEPSPHIVREYYTFGWDGKLSEKSREQASLELYDALIGIKNKKRDHKGQVSFELYSHSHGAQVVLYLPEVRKQKGDISLVIDKVVLSAAPVYQAKAQHVSSDMFKRVIHIFSEGDRIQTADFISTPKHSCCRKLADVGLQASNSADVRMLVNGNAQVLGHASFFILDRYYLPSYVKKRRHVRAILDELRPLPLVVLYPVFVPAIISKMDGYGCYDVHLLCRHGVLAGAVTQYDKTGLPDFTTLVAIPTKALRLARDETRQAYADTKYLSEMDKALHAVNQSFQTMFVKR